MADSLETQAHAAFVNDEFPLAVSLYSQAISHSPLNLPSLLVNRAQAYIRLENFTDAVADANRAIEMDPQLSKAYLRKGTAYFHLEEYEKAKEAFTLGERSEPSNTIFKKLIEDCDAAIAKGAANCQPQFVEDMSVDSGAEAGAGHTTPAAIDVPESTTRPAQNYRLCDAPESTTRPAQNYKHDFYQKSSEAVVEIFAKGLNADQVNVEFGVQLLKVTIDIPEKEPYIFQKRLNQKVIADNCRYSIFATKIEIRLAKAEPSCWKSLEYDQNQIVPSEVKIEYPSSSNKGRKDWDRLEAEVKKEEKEEKLEGDAAANKMFADIYQNADEDTRRAMNKSMYESNGTVLSTNWQDVGQRRVEEKS